ncbi:MAG: hypothetical protein K8H74_12700 [Notoacmeibacter sp.]|nr:hypothetical protein [Notoacmeibacter sp.]
MMKIFGAIYILTAPTLMGVFIVALLSMNMSEPNQIITAAIAGAILAIPVAMIIGKRVLALTKGA